MKSIENTQKKVVCPDILGVIKGYLGLLPDEYGGVKHKIKGCNEGQLVDIISFLILIIIFLLQCNKKLNKII